VIHPIEAESFRRLEARVDLSHLTPMARAVVSRVIHATADLEYASTMVVDDDAASAGAAALAAGAPVVCDVEMVRHGIVGADARCCLAEIEAATADMTRSAAAMRLALRRHPVGAVVAVGCAPTALEAAVALAADGVVTPALIIGVPVGFVGAAETKDALRAAGLPAISNVGEKGGSAVAAAIVNALARSAHG
jgi:precorrin-8X/cobalt-precorrin-8 methylmutase